jgi:hypothetical protein
MPQITLAHLLHSLGFSADAIEGEQKRLKQVMAGVRSPAILYVATREWAAECGMI